MTADSNRIVKECPTDVRVTSWKSFQEYWLSLVVFLRQSRATLLACLSEDGYSSYWAWCSKPCFGPEFLAKGRSASSGSAKLERGQNMKRHALLCCGLVIICLKFLCVAYLHQDSYCRNKSFKRWTCLCRQKNLTLLRRVTQTRKMEPIDCRGQQYYRPL